MDGAPEFAAQAIGVLRDIETVELVGVASSAELAERYLLRLRPDVVLMSLSLPDGHAPDVIAKLSRLHPAAFVALVLHETEPYRATLLRAGACEVIAKGELVTLLPLVLDKLARDRGPADEVGRDGEPRGSES